MIEHVVLGTNPRLDSIQTAVLSIKLRELPAWNTERSAAAARFAELLGDIDGVALPPVLEGNHHVWHLYVVRVAGRDRVLAELGAHGIRAGTHYPKPIHLLPAFAGMCSHGADLEMAEPHSNSHTVGHRRRRKFHSSAAFSVNTLGTCNLECRLSLYFRFPHSARVVTNMWAIVDPVIKWVKPICCLRQGKVWRVYRET
jgi:hypothetical protein